MSMLGAHKAQITKAAKSLRKKIADFDEAILEPVDLTTEAGRDSQFILNRKSLLFFNFTVLVRTVDSLRAQREKAEEFARQHPDEQGEFPFLQQIQEHWDASELDQLVEEAETLRDRVDAAIKLLTSSEALYLFRASTVPPSLCNLTPNPALDPICTRQPPQDVRMEVASHSSSHDQDRPADPDAVARADRTSPPARAQSVVQGFDHPSQVPSSHPTFANPFSTFPPSNPFVSSSVPNSNLPYPSMEQSLKLPTFEIPTFHGDVDNFLEFWDLFSTAVHNNISVPVSLKFMYLKSHLRGPAASLIAGFQSTAENYEDAVRTLTNTYGRPEILRNRLWDKLMQQPPASESPMSQRATLCTVKAIWSQLKHLKEDSSAIGTLKIIRAKFPRRTREKIGEYKTKGDSMWTVDELLSTLDTIIDRLETVEDADPSDYHSYNSQAVSRQSSPSPRRYPSASRNDPAFTRYRTSSYYPRRSSQSRTPSPYSRHNRPPTPYYPRTTSRSPSRPRYVARYEPQCAFCCDLGHSSERCRIVQDIAQRRLFVSRHKLCFLCLEQGHTYIYCNASPCGYCGRLHHKALCMDFPRASRPRLPSGERTTYPGPGRSYSPRRVQFQRETYDPPREYSSRSRASPSRNLHSESPSPSRRQSSFSPARRAPSARRSRSPTSAVHSATRTTDLPCTTRDAQAEPLDQQQACVGSHSPSSCTSVCSQESVHQEPRLMVVHAVTENYRTRTDELLTVFLDSGSQHSFICTSLAKHLGLPFRNTKEVTTLTFGGHQFTEESSEVTLVLWDQYNYPIELELWTRETITTVPRTNTRNDSDIVDYEDRVEVDVLIGIDNYWRVVDLHKNEKLPSGLTLSHTRFGPVLSGLKYPVVSNTLLASKTLFTDDEPVSDHLVRSLLGLDTVAMEEHENAEDANVIKHFYDTDISEFQLRMPRFIGYTEEDTYDLVVCSDASKRVYAMTAYIVTRPHNGKPQSSLLFAKAKLAPPGAITIPRMELLACHMAAKTVQFLRSQLKVRFHSISTIDTTPIITSDDFTAAELILIREHYRESQRQMDGSYVKKLHTKYDTDGTIRVDLRMTNAQMSDIKIEAILNTRPLFPVNSVNPSANAAIRPIDSISPQFRMARLTHSLPQKVKNSSSDNYQALNTRYRTLQTDLDRFWDVWQKEYLSVLAEREAIRAKTRSSTKLPRVGEVVLIKEDAPRSSWPLGLILELHTSKDGNIRSARIRTGKRRVVDRAVNHLLPLEVVAESEEPFQSDCQRSAKAQRRHRGVSKK
ncbi:unnamed protein product [Cylicocyclus nassatus]|uniref:DUF5641 domain-containing protein n=1 Tax=Cylicocyclus nassatus TaxID=53992 RepID=A0AA36MGT5_CYLNA|nr:unnamed protein product [Cylicocyclus nassatus]